ncbi:hypothetical protein [Brumimicrobium aurantiacum]|nr:hypothetical protein [Brumimicrobium aurantiacum]
MMKVLLFVGITIFVGVTVLGVIDGFERWSAYYFLGFFILVLYLIRRAMMKRMIKHQEFLNEQNKKK